MLDGGSEREWLEKRKEFEREMVSVKGWDTIPALLEMYPKCCSG